MHVLFDLNGTLLDAGAITEAWPGGRGAALRVLDDAVWQANVDTLNGEFRPFPGYIKAALQRAATTLGVGDDLVEQGMQAAQQLPAFTEARDALRTLRDAGHTPHVLTNSAAESAESSLRAAGLRELVGEVIGCDAVQAYKPDARPYRHALATLGTQAEETWMVAAHWWDVTGAKRAGLRTAWVGRDEGALLSTVPDPDVAAADLVTAAQRLVEAA